MKQVEESHRGTRTLWWCCLVVLLCNVATPLHAGNTYQDAGGRFAIDLPPGWTLAPQTDDATYVFQGDGNSIILQYFTTIQDLDALMKNGMTTMKQGGLINITLEQDKQLPQRDGAKARLGLFSADVKSGAVTVRLNALLGAVSLRRGGVSFLSILSEQALAEFGTALERSFEGLRDSDLPLDAADDAAMATEEAVATCFEHEFLTLDLPDGWVRTEPPRGVDSAVIGWLKSETIPGATILVACYRGLNRKFGWIRVGGLRTLAALFPLGQEYLEKKKKIRTEQGKTALVELWRGWVDNDGQPFAMSSPMAIVKTRHCWTLLIGMVAEGSGPELQADFEKILQSAR